MKWYLLPVAASVAINLAAAFANRIEAPTACSQYRMWGRAVDLHQSFWDDWGWTDAWDKPLSGLWFMWMTSEALDAIGVQNRVFQDAFTMAKASDKALRDHWSFKVPECREETRRRMGYRP